MEEICLVTDTHLGLKRSSDHWLSLTERVFNEIKEECEKRNVRTLVHLGDWFDDRKSINVKAIETSNRIVSNLKDFDLYIIVGNHDTYYKNTIEVTSLNTLTNFEHVTIVNEKMTLGDIILVPWRHPIPEATSSYLMGHFDIIDMMEGICQYSSNDFVDFDHVYSGHYHNRSTKDNLTYLGTPFQQTFGEMGYEKGFYFFKDGKLDFVKVNAPEFKKVKSDDIKEEDVRGNIVKLYFLEDYGTRKNNLILEEVQSYEPLLLDTDFSNIKFDSDLIRKEDIKIGEFEDMLVEYLEEIEVPSGVKKSVIQKMIKTLIKE